MRPGSSFGLWISSPAIEETPNGPLWGINGSYLSEAGFEATAGFTREVRHYTAR